MTSFTVVVGVVVIWLIVRKPKNTSWRACTMCHKCNKVFDRSGLHASVYVCPNCGEDTDIFYSFRYKDGKIETKRRKG